MAYERGWVSASLRDGGSEATGLRMRGQRRAREPQEAGTLSANPCRAPQAAVALAAILRIGRPRYRDDMRDFLYYSSLLLLGWAWYRFGQKQLQKAPFDENGAPTQGLVGPVGFLMTAGVAGYALFAVLRALVRGQIPCLGKGCAGQVYTLVAHAGTYWANVLFLVWLVLALGYGLYVTLKIWFR
ncbi:MAG: hypothetical protein ACN6OU_10175 [Stenotrophomonas acidaminiphila]|uniref:hypothetical protein n=1 Tax=Stenotrophomonas acidaminiphila TaxID=128780 RepID=UPI0028AC769E|nr:hypothetical protein [Stenotrophomonas acidaminiphila]